MARTIIRIDPASIPENSRGRDQFGRLVLAGPDLPGANIALQVDRTEQRVPAKQDTIAYAKPLPIILPAQHLDALAVAQIGIYRILSGWTHHGLDLQQYIMSGAADSREFQIHSVLFDHASQEQEMQPQVTATVRQGGFIGYGNPGLETEIIEDSIDQFMAGTALRRTATASVPTAVDVWCAHKEERRGLRSGFERAFLKEPHDDRSGRRVVVKEYFDREIRIEYKGHDPVDDGENAQANRWLFAARLEVTLDTVELVATPEFIEDAAFRLVIDGEPDGEC